MTPAGKDRQRSGPRTRAAEFTERARAERQQRADQEARETKAAMNAGVDNCGAEEFSEYLAEARAERGITIESDDSTPVGAILARQGR